MMMRMRRQNPHQTRPMVVRGSGTAVAVFAEGGEVMPKTDMEAAVGEPEAVAARGECRKLAAERQVEAAQVHLLHRPQSSHRLQSSLQQPQQLPQWRQLPLHRYQRQQVLLPRMTS